MKDREAFIRSVWGKSQIALAEEKRKKARRKKVTGFAAAAACIMLVVGTANLDKLQDMYNNSLAREFDDMASNYTDDGVDSHVESYAEQNNLNNKNSGENCTDIDSVLSSDMSLEYDMPTAFRELDITHIRRISLENMSESERLTINEEDKITEYMEWFYTLEDEQILNEEEFENLNDKPEEYCKFTIDKSLGEDTEEETLIYYYIVGEFKLP